MLGTQQIAATAPLLWALALAALPGCGGATQAGNADKAGGATAPVVLTIATDATADRADAAILRYFVHRFEDDSQGGVRLHIVYGAGGEATTSPEVRVGRLVRDGEFDLGWIPSRNWDYLGVDSLRALQAPFLITSYDLLDRVLTGPLGPEMLRGLRQAGVVGLALVPGELRHPGGLNHAFRGLSDFAGARLHVPPSRTTDALVHALGARPVHLSAGAGFTAYSVGEVDGKEFGYLDAFGQFVTANVTFFPTAHTLFANAKTFARLDGDRRAALRAAAAETLERATRAPPEENSLLRTFCRNGGRVAKATSSEQAGLERAARSVFAWLDRDPQTRKFIQRIRLLKHSLPLAQSPVVPPGCAVGLH